MTDDNHDDHKTAAELFAEWAKTQFDNQSGDITADFFTTATEDQEEGEE